LGIGDWAQSPIPKKHYFKNEKEKIINKIKILYNI